MSVCLIFLSSCGDVAIVKKIGDKTNSLVISGYYISGGKTFKKNLYKTDNKDEIRRILGFITDDDFPENSCGYNGIIELKMNDGFMNMEFNTDDKCSRIVFTWQDLLFSKKISPEGIIYLNNLITK